MSGRQTGYEASPRRTVARGLRRTKYVLIPVVLRADA